jgi:zinc transport system substrate-binding protein
VWIERFAAANPSMRIVDIGEGVPKLPMGAHHHGVSGDHDEDGESRLDDPHIWLSPPLAKKQAENIMHALEEIDPPNAGIYRANYERFAAELENLDGDLRKLFADSAAERRFMVFHPSWGYFAETYGLEQIPIETAGREPKPADVARLIELGKSLGIRVIFVQPQFSKRSAGAIAGALGATLIVADDLAGDWENNLRDTARRFRDALR